MEEENNIMSNNEAPDNNDCEELKKKCEEYLNGWKRAKADFINYQKDEARRFEELAKFGNEAFMKDIISILDSFDLAESAHLDDKGLRIIRTQLEDLLRKRGLEPIVTKTGDAFDPARHEALVAVDSPEDVSQPPNTIAEELEKGYTLHKKVIRPTRVKIIK